MFSSNPEADSSGLVVLCMRVYAVYGFARPVLAVLIGCFIVRDFFSFVLQLLWLKHVNLKVSFSANGSLNGIFIAGQHGMLSLHICFVLLLNSKSRVFWNAGLEPMRRWRTNPELCIRLAYAGRFDYCWIGFVTLLLWKIVILTSIVLSCSRATVGKVLVDLYACAFLGYKKAHWGVGISTAY